MRKLAEKAAILAFVTVLLCAVFVYCLSFSSRREIQVATVARPTDGGEGNRYHLNDDTFTFSKEVYFFKSDNFWGSH